MIGNFKNQFGCEEKLQVVVDKGFQVIQVTPEYFMLQLKIFSNFKHCYKTIYSFKYFMFYNLLYLKDELVQLLDTVQE